MSRQYFHCPQITYSITCIISVASREKIWYHIVTRIKKQREKSPSCSAEMYKSIKNKGLVSLSIQCLESKLLVEHPSKNLVMSSKHSRRSIWSLNSSNIAKQSALKLIGNFLQVTFYQHHQMHSLIKGASQYFLSMFRQYRDNS